MLSRQQGKNCGPNKVVLMSDIRCTKYVRGNEWIYISKLRMNILFALEMLLSDAAAKSIQSCPTLCDAIDSSPPDSPVPRILQARTLEWVAISFFNAWKWKVKRKSLSRVWLFATPWTAAHQAPPPMRFSRQQHWSGVPLPSPGNVAYNGVICVMMIIVGLTPKRIFQCCNGREELVTYMKPCD